MSMETYDLRSIGRITTFEKITRTHVKKLLVDGKGQLVFIVAEGEAGKAIGKSGMHVRKLQRLMKHPVRVVEFHHDPKVFIKNYLAPVQPDMITLKEDLMTLTSASTKTKGMLIGREKQKLQEVNDVMMKLFKVKVVVA